MELNAFLNAADAVRAHRALRKLAGNHLSSLALAGGLAIELHLLQRGAGTIIRPLHDIDFIAASFGDIPPGFGPDLLLRHVHPHDPPGKTLLQGVDPETEVRVDVFRACGVEMDRTVPFPIAGLTIRIVSFDDMLARHARLTWDLVQGQPIAPKFARDFLRMAALVPAGNMQGIWEEHRKPHSPHDFRETVLCVRKAIAARPDLLVPPTYSTDPNQYCARCESTSAFPLVDAGRILSILGYC